jgi:hypothetical protein
MASGRVKAITPATTVNVISTAGSDHPRSCTETAAITPATGPSPAHTTCSDERPHRACAGPRGSRPGSFIYRHRTHLPLEPAFISAVQWRVVSSRNPAMRAPMNAGSSKIMR